MDETDQNPQVEAAPGAAPPPEADLPASAPAEAGPAEPEVPAGAEAPDDVPDAVPDEVPDEVPALAGDDLRAVLEALVFASPEPLTPRQIGKVLQGVGRADWLSALEQLRADYDRPGRGLQLVEVAGGYQITTRPELNEWVQELLDPRAPTRLSIQALETLAVIAYKQPVTLPEVIELRGVKSGGVIKTLLEKRLIRIVGRKEVVGRPMLYGTTKEFLLHFGLMDLNQLPKVEEFAEVLGEEVDVVGLKKAIEAPRPVEAPLFEQEPAPTATEPEEKPGAAPGDVAGDEGTVGEGDEAEEQADR